MQNLKQIVLAVLFAISLSNGLKADEPLHAAYYGYSYLGQYCSPYGNYYPACAPGLECLNVNYYGAGVGLCYGWHQGEGGGHWCNDGEHEGWGWGRDRDGRHDHDGHHH